MPARPGEAGQVAGGQEVRHSGFQGLPGLRIRVRRPDVRVLPGQGSRQPTFGTEQRERRLRPDSLQVTAHRRHRNAEPLRQHLRQPWARAIDRQPALDLSAPGARLPLTGRIIPPAPTRPTGRFAIRDHSPPLLAHAYYPLRTVLMLDVSRAGCPRNALRLPTVGRPNRVIILWVIVTFGECQLMA
jgi:hypothetical protein